MTKKERATKNSREFKMELKAKPGKSRVKKNAQLGVFIEEKVDVDVEKDEFFMENDPEHQFFCQEDIPDESIDIETYVDKRLKRRQKKLCKKNGQGTDVVCLKTKEISISGIECSWFTGAVTFTADQIIVAEQNLSCLATENVEALLVAYPEKQGMRRSHRMARERSSYVQF